PPLHVTYLILHVSVACIRARRNSWSIALIFRASSVSDGIRPLGGSTIIEVRAPVRLWDLNTSLYEPETSNSVPRSARLSFPGSAARALSNSACCVAVKNSWLAYLAGRCNGVSVSSVQMPWRLGSPQGVLSAEADAMAEASGALARA